MIMKQAIIFWTLFISIPLVIVGMIFSQPSVGPHGGAVKKTGIYYIEMKSMHQEIHTYLLDKKLISIGNKGVTCEVKIVYPDSSRLIKPLKAFGNDGFSAGVPSMPFLSCSVFFHIPGKTVSAQFENDNLIFTTRF